MLLATPVNDSIDRMLGKYYFPVDVMFRIPDVGFVLTVIHCDHILNLGEGGRTPGEGLVLR